MLKAYIWYGLPNEIECHAWLNSTTMTGLSLTLPYKLMELKVFSENIANNHNGHPGGSMFGVGCLHHFVGLATSLHNK